MKTLIYVVEDDLNIQHVIKIALENSQFHVVSFEDAKTMFQSLKKQIPHLFILDIMLPGMDGLKIIQTLRNKSDYKDIPMLIVSAKSSEIDRVVGLDIGADDYLVKPFGVLELVSRVKALLRRFQKEKPKDIIEVNGLSLNQATHELSYKERAIPITNKQFDLMKYMMINAKTILSREKLLNAVWDYDFVGESRTLDVHIKELRKRIFELTNRKDIIETIHGVGYRLSL
ncbi:MAG TPA: response regulator transcription factor [Candidatus Izemoplasmatales bacterium]|nr:response regulator transcription factor [Candidatus Izemoplasmatales bacterium]